MYIADSNHNFDPPGIMAVDLEKLESLTYDIATADLPFAKDIMSYTAADGLCASCELVCISVSNDGKFIAVGSKDRLGVLYVLEL